METRINAESLAIAAGKNIKERDYWLEQLSGELIKSHFPYDFKTRDRNPDDRIPDDNGANNAETCRFTLPPQLAEKIIAVSKGSNHMLHMILVTGLKGMLYKLTGSSDIILGTAIYKQSLQGAFINTVLALRSKLHEEISFKQLLIQTKKVVVDAVAHQNYPIHALIPRLDLPGDEKDFPLFDIALLLDNIHDREYLQDISFNLLICFNRRDKDILGQIQYNPKLFKADSIDSIKKHYVFLLQQFLADANTPLAQIEIVDENEKRQILQEFNKTHMEVPEGKVLHQLFEEQVAKTPDAIALVFHHRQITYKLLNQTANQLAHTLRARGLKTDDVAALMADITMETIIGMTAILKAGGAFLPIDPANPMKRIQYLIADSGLDFLLSKYPLEDENMLDCDIIRLDLDNKEIFSGDCENPEIITRPENLAYVIYTSGSTGNPKGVMLEHRNIVNQIHGLKEMFFKDVSLNHILLAPFTFDPSVQHVYSPLTYGAKLIMVEKEEKMDSLELMTTIVTKQVDIFDAVPSQLTAYMEFASHFNSKLHFQYIILAGEVFPKELYQKIKEQFSVRTLINIYGPTEATINSTYYICPPQEKNHSIPIGKPLMNYRALVLNKELNLLPVGVSGELYISGKGVARGYFNAPYITAQKFFACPFFPGERMYATGDMVRWLADGNLEFVGREDHQVKIRGFRVELEEIEKLLLRHEEVSEGVVIDRSRKTMVDGNVEETKYLCAYFVANQNGGDKVDVQDLREFLGEDLPDYMVPGYFIQLDAIPLTAHHKLDRKNLPEPDMSFEDYTSPRNNLEAGLVEVWSHLLDIDEEKIGIDTNFFSIGGHSLKATSLVTKTQQAFDVKIPLGEIFKTPTIRELAQYINKASIIKYVEIPKAEPKQYYPLSSVQQRLFFIQQMSADNIAYNIPQVIALQDDSDVEKLEEIFNQLIQRHESFRTSFHMINNKTVQQIHDDIRLKIPRHHEGDVDTADIERHFVRPFDLSIAPLLRVELIENPSGRYLMIDMHHIISDGMSYEILVRDFATLQRGGTLIPLRIQYKDYAQWLHGISAEDDSVKKQEAFWLRQFEKEFIPLNLQIDFPRPPIWSFDGRTVEFYLDNQVTRQLKSIARLQDATLFMVLLSAFNILLAKLSSQEDIIIGTPTAGRRHEDLQQIIGMFVNTLALRNFPANQKSFMQFFQEVKVNTLAAFENQEYNFEDLVDTVVGHRDQSRNPLFNVMLVLQSQDQGVVEQQNHMPDTPGDKNFDESVAKFDLTLNGVERGGGIRFFMQYCTRLFKLETVERFKNSFLKIIETIIANPHSRIAEIDIIPEKERRQIIELFNDSNRDHNLEQTLLHMFQQQAARSPEAIAVNETASGEEITYRQLDKKTNILAGLLREMGIRPGHIAAMLLERGINMVVTMVGIIKTGAAYLPIDPAYPEDRIVYTLKDSNAKMVVTNAGNIEKVGQLNAIDIQTLPVDSTYEDQHPDPDTCLNPDSLFYIIYTSGSTGKPKGVLIKHRTFVNMAIYQRNMNHLTVGDRFCQTAGPGFDGMAWEVWPTLISGSSLYIVDGLTRMNVSKIKEWLLHHQINVTYQPTVITEQLISQQWPPHTKLRTLITAGEQLTRYPLPGLPFKLYNLYGPTEDTVTTTAALIEPQTEEQKKNKQNPSIGKLVDNHHIYILGPNLELRPIGLPGQLCISGKGLAIGYLNRPEQTAEKFIPMPAKLKIEGFDRGDRLYLTGDLARWLEDGNIEFLGRIDQQVKIRGFRIELGEIESLLQTHPSIGSVVVIARKDNGEKYLCAYLTPAHKAPRSWATVLREFLGRTLPDYMIPSHFVQLEKIPFTANGKVDKQALPEPVISREDEEYTPPRNQLEHDLAEIWAEVLEVNKKDVGIDFSFFQLGGHSLKATVLVYAILEKMRKKVSLVDLFQRPTIRQLAKLISNLKEEVTADLSGNQHVIHIRKSSVDSNNLFFIHDVSGDVDGYIEFCNRLQVPINCIGIRAERLENHGPRTLTIGGLAEKYIAIIKDIQPQGPYHIAGWSMGGTIAFEIVRQFEAASKPVGFFAMIDVSPPVTDPQVRQAQRFPGIGSAADDFTVQSETAFVKDYLSDSGILSQLCNIKDVQQFWKLIVDYLNRAAITNADLISGIRESIINHEAFAAPNPHQLEVDQLIRYLNMGRSFVAAWLNYIPSAKIASPIHFFQPHDTEDTTKIAKWRGYTADTLTSHRIYGDHFSIFKDPDVQDFATLFNKLLP